MDPRLLAPPPRVVETTGQPFRPPTVTRVALDARDPRLRRAAAALVKAWNRLAPGRLRARPADDGSAEVRLRLGSGETAPPQGYTLSVDPTGVVIEGADSAGLSYGVQTLLQWLRLHQGQDEAGVLTGLRVRDWPDLPRRGALLDISRGRVPRMDALFALVDRLASWKINELQLYTEHTFAYRGHEIVWRGASPMQPGEIRALDAFCRERFIKLVPNQNSFGHFHRWLRHQPYRDLAEVPEGLAHPFSLESEPFSLCPLDPKALALLDDLYGQLLPNFSSPWFNVGLDETFDLGKGRSRAACETRGKTSVYLDFLRKVADLARKHGRRVQFWGDIVLARPESLARLPKDAMALIWGYEADHPFAEQTRRLADAGLAFYVCPGTSSWNSVAGRTDNALQNLAAAARWGRERGAAGCLIADWGDNGHLQPPSVGILGMLAGAAFAWNADAAADPLAAPVADWLSRHAFDDASGALGRVAYDLGNVYRTCGFEPANGSALFYPLRYIDQTLEYERLAGLNREGLARAGAAIDRAMAIVPKTAGGVDQSLPARELAWAADLLRWCGRLGLAWLAAGHDRPARAIEPALRTRMRADLEPLIAEHRSLWPARCRPGGLEESSGWLLRAWQALA